MAPADHGEGHDHHGEGPDHHDEAVDLDHDDDDLRPAAHYTAATDGSSDDASTVR